MASESQDRKKRHRSRQTERPPPPPEPPGALVHLLQNDVDVYQYFQSLQANLDSDIQKWKTRAISLRHENVRLKSQVQERQPTTLSSKITASVAPNHNATTARKLNHSITTRSGSSSKKNSNKGRIKEKPIRQGNKQNIDFHSTVHDTVNADSSNSNATGTTGNVETTTPPIQMTFLPEVGVPIEDSMFDELDSNSDESLVNPEHDRSTACGQSEVNDTTTPFDEAEEIFDFLKEAYEIFQDLGLALVNVIHPPDHHEVEESLEVRTSEENSLHEINGDHGDEVKTNNELVQLEIELGDSVEKKTARVESRPDELVMTDILDRISNQNLTVSSRNNATRVNATSLDDFVHVSNECVTLSCNPLPFATTEAMHPLLEGKRSLFRALILVDTFCASTILQRQWDRFFEGASTKWDELQLRCMKIGMRGRKNLVDRLIHWINIQISERWAYEDRYKRQLNTSAHYVKNEEIIENENPAIVGKRTFFYGNLIERSTLCQLATGLLLLRNDSNQAIQNIFQYAVSTTPSPNLEDHPKFPPLLSLSALESMLLLSDRMLLQYQAIDDITNTEEDKSATWFHRQISKIFTQSEQASLVFASLALAIHVSASIWKLRVASSIDRIHHIASIEMSSYRRLVSYENTWLSNIGSSLSMNTCNGKAYTLDQECKEAHQIVSGVLACDRWQDISTVDSFSSDSSRVTICLPLEIALILGENVILLDQLVRDKLHPNDKTLWNDEQTSIFCVFLTVLVKVRREILLRQCETYRSHIEEPPKCLSFGIGDFSELTKIILEVSSVVGTSNQVLILCTALNSSVIAADGSSALSIMQQLLAIQGNGSPGNLEQGSCIPNTVIKSLFDCVRRLSAYPVVRVINLERRKDRMKSFLEQALREHLLVFKAVTDFEVDEGVDKVGSGFGYEFGRHAVDGQGRLVEATERLVLHVGSIEVLNEYVSSSWRPNDLKPFDVDAPNSDELVRISPSERACALSHILSWKGVLRSLNLTPDLDVSKGISRLFCSPQHILRLFKISGFAQGPALLDRNNMMPPTPVCVILEDDAILVDRFKERLEEVLQDLPRDFHFCSLGYSRPKSAPIAPYSDKIGIPSMLWYLTGYCMSEAGAQYLLGSLPVVGPVDSWIGLKMTNNWDNVFGMKLGVGIHSKPNSELPSRKDLCRILQFRAYCVLHPLCTQKVRVVGTATTGGAIVAATQSGRHWRQRDTDIDYSGGNISKIAGEAATITRQR
jgi:hypothetical protein